MNEKQLTTNIKESAENPIKSRFKKNTKNMGFDYINPKDVKSPHKVIANLKVLYDGGEGGVSVASMMWNGNDAIGIRWNVSMNEHSNPNKQNGSTICLGMPVSYTHPVWFIMPSLEELPQEVKEMIRKTLKV